MWQSKPMVRVIWTKQRWMPRSSLVLVLFITMRIASKFMCLRSLVQLRLFIMTSHYHIPESNLVVTYNAVNQNFRKLNEEELNESELRNKFDITGNRIILSVGNLQPRKNLPRLMRAFVKLKKDSHFSDVQLVVVGKKAFCANEEYMLFFCHLLSSPSFNI